MALLFFAAGTPLERKMTNPTTLSDDDTARYPETVGDCDDHGDPHQLAPEADEVDPEEAGYGYGV
jgi:hypothetical protein